MKKGDLVKHHRAPWLGIITRVKRFKDPPAGIQHVELVWLSEDVFPQTRDVVTPSLLLMVSEA